MTQGNPFLDTTTEAESATGVEESTATLDQDPSGAEPETVAPEDEEEPPPTTEELLEIFDGGRWDPYNETERELVVTTGGWPFTEMWFELDNSDDEWRWSYGRCGTATSTIDSGLSATQENAVTDMRKSFEAELREETLAAQL